jgi:hypothetical protein
MMMCSLNSRAQRRLSVAAGKWNMLRAALPDCKQGISVLQAIDLATVVATAVRAPGLEALSSSHLAVSWLQVRVSEDLKRLVATLRAPLAGQYFLTASLFGTPIPCLDGSTPATVHFRRCAGRHCMAASAA